METSASLLDSLQQAPNEVAWQRLVDLYSPMMRNWLKRYSAVESDIDDIVQEALTVVVRRFPEFRREPRTGAFRSWLRTITANCLRDYWRRKNRQPPAVGGTEFGVMVDQLQDPGSGLSKLWNQEHDKHVTQYLLQQIKADFTEQTWQAFQRFALDGLSADDVAKELNITPNAVFIAKSRVMASLRRHGDGLID